MLKTGLTASPSWSTIVSVQSSGNKPLIIAGILGGLLVLALVGKTLRSFQERPAVSQAWVSAIEKGYPAQIGRLRSAASTATNSNDRLQPVREDDRRLFGAPEILEAMIQFQPRGWEVLSKQSFRFSRGRGRAGFILKPRPGSAIAEETTYWDEEQKRTETLRYLGVIRNQNGEPRQYALLFDRSKLSEPAEVPKKKPGRR